MNVENVTLKRICPSCGREIHYKRIKSLNNAESHNTRCRSCTLKSMDMSYKSSDKFKQKLKKPKKGTKGGLKQQWINRYGEELAEQKWAEHLKILSKSSRFNSPIDLEYRKTDNYRKQCSRKGEKNAFSKGLKRLWIEKYGEEIAEQKWKERALKLSAINTGSGNPMFGKTPSWLAGRGFSCKYKGKFFRSILELSYFIQIIERFKLDVTSGETKDLKIKYSINGIDRTYSADFLINGKYLVEIKPKALQNTEINRLKFIAARNFCEKHGLKFKVTSVSLIEKSKLLEMLNNDEISVHESNLDSFLEWLKS